MKRTAVVLVVTMLLAGGAACTKKDAQEALTTATTITTAETPDGDRTADVGSDTGRDVDSSDSPSSTPSPDSGDGGCPTPQEAQELTDVFGGTGAMGADFDFGELEKSMQDAVAVMRKSLPASLQPDLDIVASTIEEMFGLLSQIDLSNPESITPEQAQKFQEFETRSQSPEFTTAMDNLTTYFREHCDGLDIGSGS